jgi:hypothetical protein
MKNKKPILNKVIKFSKEDGRLKYYFLFQEDENGFPEYQIYTRYTTVDEDVETDSAKLSQAEDRCLSDLEKAIDIVKDY